MMATQSATTPRPPRRILHVDLDIRGFEYQLKVYPDGRIVEHVEDFVNCDAGGARDQHSRRGWNGLPNA